MNIMRKKLTAASVCLLLAVSLTLSACGTQNNTPEVTETPGITLSPAESLKAEIIAGLSETGQSAGESTDPAEDAGQTASESEQPSWYAGEGLVGSPWPTSVISGNITAECPDRKDDIYMHYNYDYLKENEGKEWAFRFTSRSSDLHDTIESVIADKSKTSHDIEQLRILYSQACDTETLKKQGASEIMPYIEKIQAVSTIEDMNRLLTSEDFPFDPFFLGAIGSMGQDDGNLVCLYPKFLFVDSFFSGASYYGDVEDPDNQNVLDYYRAFETVGFTADAPLAGIDPEEVQDIMQDLLYFEITYGRYAYYSTKYINEKYGTFAEIAENSVMTLDELEKLCPSIPIRAILEKEMMGSAEKYCVLSYGWLTTLNAIWGDDYVGTLKNMALAKLFKETRDLRDKSEYNELCRSAGFSVSGTKRNAYDVCDTNDTFAHLLAELYVSEALGGNAAERITEVAHDLVDTYKTLIDEAEWLDIETREAIKEKLDNMQMNILAPASGYYDFDDLELVPADKGGTLLGNYLILKKHRAEQELKILSSGKTVESAWYITAPTTANAFYDEFSNSINILAGFVTSAIYTEDMDKSDLVGSLGDVIGHEISHAFDIQASQLDSTGKPGPLFRGDDLEEYLAISDRLSEYYSTVELKPGLYVDGKNIVAEAFADLSGIQAVLTYAENNGDIDFDRMLGTMISKWAQVFKEKIFNFYVPDPHPFSHLRININLQMFDIIYEKIGIKEGDGMYLAPEKRIVIWGKDAA